MKRFMITLSLLALMLLSSCNMLLERAAKEYSIDLQPKELSVARGEAKTFTVEIKPLAGSLTVAMTELSLKTPLPSGLSLEPSSLSIPTAAKPETLTLTASKTAALVKDLELEFMAVRDGLAAYAKIKLSITEALP